MDSVVLDRDTVANQAKVQAGRSRKKLALVALALAVGAGCVWYGYDWWTQGRFIESTDDAYIGGDVTTVSPHIAGFLTDIQVADNQHVQAGQILARMDQRDFQAALDRAQAIVEARTAAAANLQAQYVLQQSAIRQSAADVVAKAAHVTFTHQEAERYASLAQTSTGSRQNAQKTLADDQEAAAAVQSSQAALEVSRQQLNVLDTRMAEARADIAQAEAELRTARLNLGYTEIRSPIEGYVGNRAARAGAYVSAGSYLLSVIPAQGLWIDANFKEDQLARMSPGQQATTTADVAPSHVFHGHVLSLAPGTGAIFSVIPPENATGNFTKIVQRVPVRIALDAGDANLGMLRPGLSTTVRVDTRHE